MVGTFVPLMRSVRQVMIFSARYSTASLELRPCGSHLRARRSAL
jgi:hypothetical protein